MFERQYRLRRLAACLLGLGTLVGMSLQLKAAANAPAAESVRPGVQSLGRLQVAYEQALLEQGQAPAVAALPLPAGFIATNGPNVLPARLVKLAMIAAQRPTPKGADGHPDLNGNWAGQNAMIFGIAATNQPRSAYDPVDLALALSIPDMRAAALERLVPTNVPAYKPEHIAKVRELYQQRTEEDSTAGCGWAGLPRMGAPTHISHAANTLAFVYNDPNGSAWRVIDLTRESLPPEADSTFTGTSLARWEGDTLVVESYYLPRETWFGEYGYFHGRDMKLIEKFHRTGDIMTYQATVEDPSVLTQPWTRDAITLFLTGAHTESLIHPCTSPEADAEQGATVLFVTRQY